jgi:hypothetical protein
MGIVGGRPESGVRILLVRDAKEPGPPWRYRGSLATPDAEHALGAVIDGAGEVIVELVGAPAELAEKVRLILRTVHRQSIADGDRAPPRRIERWRGEK